MSKDRDLLTVDELKAIEAEVQKELDKEQKAKAKDTVKAELLRAARIKRGMAEGNEEVTIDLPESADRIVVNGVAYMHGATYSLPAGLSAMLRDTMHRSWQHQAQIEGRTRDFYTKRNTRMSGITGAVTGGPLRA